MNNDLISKSALLELAHNHVGGTVDCNDIARFPAVDAEPVRHGRWIEGFFANTFECSVCFDNGVCLCYKKKSKHCPECGAKMDAEAEG